MAPRRDQGPGGGAAVVATRPVRRPDHLGERARRRVLWLAGAASLGLIPACVSGTVAPLPPPPTTIPGVTATTAADFTGVSIGGVSGQTTTTTVAVGPGNATISGTVNGPQGPVAGATVDAQRVTDAGTADATVTTAANGGILGGRYRVRAWRAPDMALTNPVVFFLSDNENHQLQLQMQQYTGTQVQYALAPSPPVVDQPANLEVQVTQTAVGNDGVVRSQGTPNVGVTLTGSSNWTVQTPNPVTTDSNGQAGWQLVCTSVGSQPISVQLDTGAVYPLQGMAPCVYPPPATTTTTSPFTTSTTSPGSSPPTSTTTTTRGKRG